MARLAVWGGAMRALLLLLLALPLHAASNQIELRDATNTNYCSADSGGVFGCVGGPAPTDSGGCGGLGFAVVGNDNAFQVTVGATPGSSCQVNFGHTWESTVVGCVGSDLTTGQLLSGVPTSITIKLTGTVVSGDVIQMKCGNIFTSAPTKGGVFNMFDSGGVIRAWVSSNTILNLPENQESGTALTITGCGSGASIVGSSRIWRLTMASAGAVLPCIVNFTNNWDVAPHCVLRNEDSLTLSTGVATTTSMPIFTAAVKDHIVGFCEDQVVGL